MPAKPNVAELIAQLPDVDAPRKPDPKKGSKPDEAAAAQPAKPEPPPEPPPDPNRPGKFTGPSPDAAERMFAEIVAGGRKAVEELIGLVRAPGDPDFKNYKAGYALHGVALYVGRTGHGQQRHELADALADQLGKGRHSKAARALFIQELQAVGGTEAASALGRHLLDEDLCEPAARALLSIREGAAAEFRAAFPRAKGRNRLCLVQALGEVRDAQSVPALKEALVDEDREVRIAAASALAKVGEASAIEAMTGSADKAQGWERIQMTNACLVLAENLNAAGKKAEARRLYTHLLATRKDESEGHVRAAAEKALATAPY